MSFIEAFDGIKTAMKNAKAKEIEGHLAIQVNLNDADSSGIFYIEVNDKKVYVEPYDYYDRDAMFTVNSKDFAKIMTGKLSFDNSVKNGKLGVEGNIERAMEIKKLIAAPKKKAAAKKPKPTNGDAAAVKTTKKTEKKTDKE